MSSDTPANYVAYNLRSYFSKQPADLRFCPNCGKDISVSNISPSKVVIDCLTSAIIPSHEFSVLYRCQACYWWAIRESWGDRECNDGPDYLAVGNEMSTPDTSPSHNQDAAPWNLALEDEHLYDKVLPLPDTLGRLFMEYRERT